MPTATIVLIDDAGGNGFEVTIDFEPSVPNEEHSPGQAAALWLAERLIENFHVSGYSTTPDTEA